MSHEVCKDVGEWTNEKVWQPIDRWFNQEEQRCEERDCDWWCACCNKWFCWLVWVVRHVVDWILVPVVNWVVHTVCEIVADFIDLIKDVLTGFWDIILGVLTGNWARVWDGFVTVVGGIGGFARDILRILYLGDALGYFIEQINEQRLRDYVRDLIDNKENFTPEDRQAIKDALGVDFGAFGFRIRTRAIRTFVRSDFRKNGNAVPELIRWHEDASLRLNLKELCGYDYAEFWRRFRPEVVGDNGDVSEDDIDEYINTRGAGGPAFSIFCMDEGTLDNKLHTASEKSRALGLLLRWQKEQIQVTLPEHVRHVAMPIELESFLATVIGRKRKLLDEDGAKNDLCSVAAVGVFRYTEKENGITANLEQGACRELTPSDVSGLTFMDRLPDFVWQYVLVHEMGHYFGLCHADGLNRIMYTAAEDQNKSWWDWWLVPDYVYLNGGPVFIFDEAKSAWNYIIANFPASCLSKRAD